MRGMEVMYKKNSDEVRLIQCREEEMRVLKMCHQIQHLGTLERRRPSIE